MLTAVVLLDSRLMHKAIRFPCVIIAEERLLKLFCPPACMKETAWHQLQEISQYLIFWNFIKIYQKITIFFKKSDKQSGALQ